MRPGGRRSRRADARRGARREPRPPQSATHRARLEIRRPSPGGRGDRPRPRPMPAPRSDHAERAHFARYLFGRTSRFFGSDRVLCGITIRGRLRADRSFPCLGWFSDRRDRTHFPRERTQFPNADLGRRGRTPEAAIPLKNWPNEPNFRDHRDSQADLRQRVMAPVARPRPQAVDAPECARMALRRDRFNAIRGWAVLIAEYEKWPNEPNRLPNFRPSGSRSPVRVRHLR